MRYFAIVLLTSFLLLGGCSTVGGVVQDHPAAAQLTIQYATVKFIGDDVERAQRVQEVTKLVGTWVEADTEATVDALMSRVRENVREDRLDPADRILLDALLTRVADELLENVGEGVLAGDDLLVLSTVLTWVNEAAALSTP